MISTYYREYSSKKKHVACAQITYCSPWMQINYRQLCVLVQIAKSKGRQIAGHAPVACFCKCHFIGAQSCLLISMLSVAIFAV